MPGAWLTQSGSIPARITKAICLPDDPFWEAQFLGAFLSLTEAENWEEHGALSSEEMSDEWRAIFFEYIEGACSMIPVGTILEYGGDTAPSGFFMCDFSPFVRADFPELFAVIGTKYGPGNGTTTANLPPRQGRVGIGRDPSQAEFDTVGETGGAKSHTLTVAQTPAHGHVQNAHGHTQDAHGHTQSAHGHTQNAHGHTQDSHNHDQNSHVHNVSAFRSGSGGSVQVGLSTFNSVLGSANVGSIIAANIAATATNQNATATNQNSTPAIQNATATNQNATATNQNTGGGESHPQLPPYLVSNYIIKY
jgi:microcystin-dependent protein